MGERITVVPLQRIKKSFAGGIIVTDNWEMIAQRIQIIRSMWWMEITAQLILQISLKLQRDVTITVPLKVAGRFFAGGAGGSGQLGNGETLDKDHPVLVKMQNADSSLSNLSNIVQITAGYIDPYLRP